MSVCEGDCGEKNHLRITISETGVKFLPPLLFVDLGRKNMYNSNVANSNIGRVYG